MTTMSTFSSCKIRDILGRLKMHTDLGIYIAPFVSEVNERR